MAGIEFDPLSILVFSLGILLPLVLPIVQFGVVYKLWDQHAVEVKRDYCQNSCWDTVFKAGYETGAGSYKHVYFNATWESAAMWAITLLPTILLYEAVKYLCRLWIQRRLRWRMVVLFIASVYPHYYAFWALWGYLNDDFYSQLSHQMLFTVTELISTLAVLNMADKELQASPSRLLVVVAIAGGHVLAAAWDQFLGNVMLGEGGLHQVLRDLGFMVPDLLLVVLPLQQLGEYAALRRVPSAYLVSNKLAGATVGTSLGIWLLSLLL